MSSPVVPLLVVVLVLCGIVVAVRRALEVLVVDFRAGAIVRARGRATAELLGELGDVGRRARVTGRLTIRLEGGLVAVRTNGIDEGTEQRFRNVVGRFPKARLTQARKLS